MMPKQTDYKVGIYLRFSRDDERHGESLSIKNQRRVLTNYVKEQDWTIYDEYVDDGISGVTFDRPGVQRMLEDAKAGNINLILCKDMSRFGRNYIAVGQYLDYLFPMYNIRFIALTDNIDTLNSDSASMDMLPIMNVFNEWFAANTSKKLRAVFESNARSGKYKTTFAAYGYVKGDDANFTPQIDPEAAEIVRRIFEMRAAGWNVAKISETLNSEGILPPQDYKYSKLGKEAPQYSHHLWSPTAVKRILSNQIYLGHLAQLRTTTVSYKNHKTIQKSADEWAVVENNHEAIVSQELWDKVREIEASVSTGKQTKKGVTMPLSGLGYCADCGTKMKQHYSSGAKAPYGYVCGFHARFGKEHCTSHHINYTDLESIILQDIRRQIDFVMNDDKAREKYLAHKRGESVTRNNADKKKQKDIVKRITDLDKPIQKIYEDRVLGNMPDKTCADLLILTLTLFNEWHAASTSKKIKAVNAKAGKYRMTCAPFGYTKGDNPNHLPVIDPDAAPIVRNIFEMRASGISPHHIADKLNEDGVPIPSDYYYAKLGKPNPRRTRHMWSPESVRQILHNYTYLGHLVQLRTTTVSYKNHKVIKNDEENMIVVKNTHEPIVSQELWDRVREVETSVAQGKRNSSGFVANLSELIYCQDCGNKVRLAWNNTTNGSKKKPRKYLRHNYNCTS